MALLGKDAKIYVSTDGVTGATYVEVGGINSIDLDESRNTADTSRMGDAADRLQASTFAFSGSASGVREPSDVGQTAIVTAYRATGEDAGKLWVKVEESVGEPAKALCMVGIKRGMKQGADAQSFSFDFKIAGGAAPTYS